MLRKLSFSKSGEISELSYTQAGETVIEDDKKMQT